MILTWSAIIGVVVVAASSLLKNVEWPAKVKVALATVLSVLGGAGSAALAGSFTGTNVTTSIAVVFAASQLLYKFILEGTPVEAKLANSLVTPKSN